MINKGPSKESAVDVLRRYKADLEFDLALSDLIEIPQDAIRNKRERLEQIEQYLECMNYAKGIYKRATYGKYPTRVTELLKEKTNCFSVLLAPSMKDSAVRSAGYIFSVKRDKEFAPLRDSLLDYFADYENAKISSLRENILEEVQEIFGKDERSISEDFIDKIRGFLEKKIKVAGADGIDLTKSRDNKVINLSYISDMFLFGSDEVSPKELADNILLAALSSDFWKDFDASCFNAALSEGLSEKRSDTLSVLTQFLLAEINLFCYSHDKSKKDFGEILDGSEGLRSKLFDALVGAENIEQAVINFINRNTSEFGLDQYISPSEAEEIIARFNMEYRIIKDSPHLDEFILFDASRKGEFVNHHNRISFHFAHFLEGLQKEGLVGDSAKFLGRHLKAFSRRAENENKLAVKSEIVKDYVVSKESLRELFYDVDKRYEDIVAVFNRAIDANVRDFIKLFLETVDVSALSKGQQKHIIESVIIRGGDEYADFIELIIERGIEVNYTYVVKAIENSQFEFAQALLKYIDDKYIKQLLFAVNGYNKNFLMWLVANADQDYVMRLLEFVSNDDELIETTSTSSDDDGMTALDYAIAANRKVIANKILEVGDIGSILFKAAQINTTKTIDYIFENFHDDLQDLFAVKNNKNETAFMWFAYNGNREAVAKVLELARIDEGFAIEMLSAVDDNGYTVLEYAIAPGYIEIVKDILDFYPDDLLRGRDDDVGFISLAKKDNKDLIDSMLKNLKDYPEVLKRILKITNSKKENALMWFAANGNRKAVAKVLELARRDEGFAIEMLGAVDDNGYTALGYAMESGHIGIVKDILDFYQDDLLRDDNARFISVAQKDNKDLVDSMLKNLKDYPEVLKRILKITNSRNENALMWFAYNGNQEAVAKVLELVQGDKKFVKEVLSAVDDDGYTALDYAIEKEDEEIIKNILSLYSNDQLLKFFRGLDPDKHSDLIKDLAKSVDNDPLEYILENIDNSYELAKSVIQDELFYREDVDDIKEALKQFNRKINRGKNPFQGRATKIAPRVIEFQESIQELLKVDVITPNDLEVLYKKIDYVAHPGERESGTRYFRNYARKLQKEVESILNRIDELDYTDFKFSNIIEIESDRRPEI